jgi:hypothetical protein
MTGESSLSLTARVKVWSDCDGSVEISGIVDDLEQIRKGQAFSSLASCEASA